MLHDVPLTFLINRVRFIDNVRVEQIIRIINVCGDSSRSIIMMTARANALGNAFALGQRWQTCVI